MLSFKALPKLQYEKGFVYLKEVSQKICNIILYMCHYICYYQT